ncbi:MAG: hypothetical protein KJ574_00615 [Nanoarchaeota archaeon]|nr:hypothetical protein [Nanoarchaeota archaeon]
MAERIKDLFRELRWEVFKIIVLDSVLDTIIFFFIVQIIMAFFNLSIFFTAALAAILFAVNVSYRMRHVKLRDVEKNNPSIKEILRTANDNINETNFVAEALFEDLILRMKNVSSGSMMKHGHVLTKMSIVFLLGFVMIVLAAHHVTVDMIDIPGIHEGKYSTAKRAAREIFGIEFNESTDIYGNANIVKLGTEEVTMKLNPMMNEINLAQVKDVEDKEFEEARFPSDIKAVSESPSEEKAPEEADIAIAYNLKLKEQLH